MLVDGYDGANRREIIGADNRSGSFAGFENALHGPVTTVDAIVVVLRDGTAKMKVNIERSNNRRSRMQEMTRVLKRVMMAGFLVWMALEAGHASAQGASVQKEFQRGVQAMRAGHNSEAEAAFREAVKLAPEIPEAHLDLGLMLGREGKLDEAIAEVRESLRLDPNLASAQMFLGIFLHQQNRNDEARTALEAELARDPKNGEALSWLGVVDLAAGRPDLAAGALDRAAEMLPDDMNVLEYRARAHSQVAKECYARMARLDPGSWHVHRVQAELFAEQGKHTEAAAEYEAAIKLEDRNPDLYEGLGQEYRSMNQLDPAAKAFARELELSPSNLIAMYNLGSTDIELGNNAAGVALLRRFVAASPGLPVAEYYLGRGLAADGDDKEAVKWLELSANGDHEGEVGKRSFYELTRLYRKLQQPVDSQRALDAYNHIREEQDKKNAQQAQDWRKLEMATEPAKTPAQNPQP